MIPTNILPKMVGTRASPSGENILPKTIINKGIIIDNNDLTFSPFFDCSIAASTFVRPSPRW